VNTKSAESGFPFVSVLTIVFIVLKLTGTIGWSWWWVLSPLWISLLAAIAIGVIAVVGYVIFAIVFARKRKARRTRY